MEDTQLLMSATGIELEYPAYVWFPSPWLWHVPLAFWVIEVHRPASVVELGVVSGNAFCAFLQAARSIGLEGRFLAVTGTREAPGQAAIDDFRLHCDLHYRKVSTLLQASFDAALTTTADRSLDLLHIDGTRAGDIARLIESWLPKMSRRGLMLLHGIAGSREHQALWQSLASRYPSFGFTHEQGLGVLYTGSEPPAGRLASLLQAGESGRAELIAAYFARLGASVADRAALQRAEEEISRLKAQAPAAAALTRAPLDDKARVIERDVALRILRQQAVDALRYQRRYSLSFRTRLATGVIQRVPPAWKRLIPLRVKLHLARFLSGG